MEVLTPTIVDGMQIYKLPQTTTCTKTVFTGVEKPGEDNYRQRGIPTGIPHPDSAAER